MVALTRSATNKTKGPREPAKLVLKIKPTTGQVRTTVQLATTEKQKAAIEKAAAIEAGLCQARERELQEALYVTRPVAPRQTSTTDAPLELDVSNAVGECSPCSDVEGGEMGGSEEGTTLFLNDAADDQFSPAAEQDSWEDEPEWTGFGGGGTMSMPEGDADPTDEPLQSAAKPTRQTKLNPNPDPKPKSKPKKALFIRDLVKIQIHKDDLFDNLEPRKRKLADGGDQPAAKRVTSRSKVDADGDVLKIRPGFLEDDDTDTIQRERRVASGKGKKASKSIVKVTHENAPPTAGEKRKKSNVANCYLKEFDTRFAPELIKCVSEDMNPWQPTFNTDLAIAKIRRRIYPNITETFEDKDPLVAPAFTKVTNWRAAIGRRAMAVVKAYFGDRTIFETTNDIAEHVSWLLPSQDADEDDGANAGEVEESVVSIEEVVRQRKRNFVGAPFLWENGLIGVACEEQPSGYLLNPIILETFAIHFETTGINTDPIECDSRPVGALALTLAAVERAIGCWETGQEEPPTQDA